MIEWPEEHGLARATPQAGSREAAARIGLIAREAFRGYGQHP